MTREPLIHRIYGRVRPALQRAGVSGALRSVFSAASRETAARLFGLEGYAQPVQTTADAPSKRDRRFAFVFICQHGEIEIEAALLAISLKRHLRCDYELHAAVPTPAETWGTPSAAVLDLLRSLNVQIHPITNPIGPSFPNGNKLPCFKIETRADKLFYLDSDILLIRDFTDDPVFDAQLNAKPNDIRRSVDIREEWPAIYDAAGVPAPTARQPTTSSKEFGFPQFNGGVICIDPTVALADTWEHHIRLVRGDDRLTPERVWTDQIGLAVAIQKLGVEVGHLDERYNFPLHHKRLNSGISPYFVHYHYPHLIAEEPTLLGLVQEFTAQHPPAAGLLQGKPEWEALLAKRPAGFPRIRRPRSREREPEFAELIIAGIPHSGSSELCQWLECYSNCIVAQAPEAIPTSLCNGSAVPWGVGLYYREARRKAVTDNAAVDNERFILGTANSAGILVHLQRIRRVMPQARVILCVRNPLTTIAAWKRSDGPESRGAMPSTPPGSPDDPWLTERHRAQLERIAAETHLPQRRAMLWQSYAEAVLNEAPNATIVRYEELVAHPAAVTAAILKGYDKGRLRQRPARGDVRQAADGLDADDAAAIRAICSQAAAELGLDMTFTR